MKSYTLASTTWDNSEMEAIQDVLQSGQLTMGEQVLAFEQEFADYVGAKYAVAVSNGTAALHLSALALDVKVGDNILKVYTTALPSSAYRIGLFDAKGNQLGITDFNKI